MSWQHAVALNYWYEVQRTEHKSQRMMRRSQLWAVAAVALGGDTGHRLLGRAEVGGCPFHRLAARPRPPPRPENQVYWDRLGSPEREAYSQCMRSHGVPNFPDPVLTPSGGYGYRTTGIDPNSSAFQGALKACQALPSPWQSTGRRLSPAQQQAWSSLGEVRFPRSRGAELPDPTFSGEAVQISGAGGSRSPQLQSAMAACKSQMPSTGGVGG